MDAYLREQFPWSFIFGDISVNEKLEFVYVGGFAYRYDKLDITKCISTERAIRRLRRNYRAPNFKTLDGLIRSMILVREYSLLLYYCVITEINGDIVIYHRDKILHSTNADDLLRLECGLVLIDRFNLITQVLKRGLPQPIFENIIYSITP